jgi:hypothetical protein
VPFFSSAQLPLSNFQKLADRKYARTLEKLLKVPPQTLFIQSVAVGGFSHPVALFLGVKVGWHFSINNLIPEVDL